LGCSCCWLLPCRSVVRSSNNFSHPWTIEAS
jgi:hypothetical protein